MMSRRWPTWVQVRKGIIFAAGLAGVAYETLAYGAERPTLLILFGAMIGLPVFLRADEKLAVPPPPNTSPPPVPVPGVIE